MRTGGHDEADGNFSSFCERGLNPDKPVLITWFVSQQVEVPTSKQSVSAIISRRRFDDVVAAYGLGMSGRRQHMSISSFPVHYFSSSQSRVLFLVWLLYFALMGLFLEINKA